MMDSSKINRIFDAVLSEGRTTLLEHEVYQLLTASGLKNTPKYQLVQNPDEITDSMLHDFPGDKIVLKVSASFISHKSDCGGVQVVEKSVDAVKSAVRNMLDYIPERFHQWIQNSKVSPPEQLKNLSTDHFIDAVSDNIQGIMMTEFIVPSIASSGYEILCGLRWTREFGPVLTLGSGGIETEILAESMKPGIAAVTVSAVSVEPEFILDQFKSTLVYRKSSGMIRGSRRVISDSIYIECFRVLSSIAAEYGPYGSAPYVIRELEINPFVITQSGLVPLDGLCTIKKRATQSYSTPVQKIGQMLHPKNMAIIGVSAQKLNMGRIILRNIIKNGFDIHNLYVIRPETDFIDDVRCVPSIKDLPGLTDVLVLAIDASQAPQVIRDAAESGKVNSVIIIPGGLGEKSGTEEIVKGMNEAIQASRQRADQGPVFVGGNCLGILSRPGNYDTLFVPEQKLPKNYDKSPNPVAFLSQSGARMITVMSQHSDISPQFAISTGNQMDLGISEFLEYMADNEPEIRVFAVYVEGFKDLGGLDMIQTVGKLKKQSRQVVFYKAGRTAAGKTATSGHTASVAGDYSVCSQLLEQAGAIVSDDFTEFNELIRLAVALREKSVTGKRLAAISNAGYETVGMADNIEGKNGFTLAEYNPETSASIKEALVKGKIDTLVDIRNPMDVTPMANDETHEAIIQAQLNDANVDCMVAATIPLTPAQQTLPAGIFGKEDILNPDSYPNRLIGIFKSSCKPMIAVIDSGILYDPMVKMMNDAGLPVFRTADLALRIFGKYLTHRMNECVISQQLKAP